MSKKEGITLVSKLRFSEYSSIAEWKITTLNSIAAKITMKNKECSVTRILTNSAVNGVVDQSDYFEREIVTQSNIDNYFIVDEGDYVYNPRISNFAPVGPISKNKIGKGIMSPLYTVFRFDNPQNDFYDQYFKTNLWNSYIKNISNTGARHDRISISAEKFMEMPLPYSTDEEEQQKIAECLSSLDELINAENGKLEALKQHKISLMCKLFSRDLRFWDENGGTISEWKNVKLVDTLELIVDNRGKTPDVVTSGVPLIEVAALGNFRINYSNIKKYVTEEVFQNWFRTTLKHGDILFSTVGRIGLCSYYDESTLAAVAQNVVGLRFNNDYNSVFMLYMLTESNNSKYIQSIVMSAVQPSIKITQFIELLFSVPDLPEQQKIADCLSALDCLIAAQTEKNETLKQHKKALMQGLFPCFEEVVV